MNFSLGCAGCGEDIRSGQSLLALEKQWHLWCFTCTKCGCLLAGEYMGRLVQSHIISILFSGVSWKIEPGCCYLIVYSAEPQGLESICFVISCVLWRSTIALWQLIIQHIRKGDIFLSESSSWTYHLLYVSWDNFFSLVTKLWWMGGLQVCCFFVIFRDGKPYCEKDYQAEFGVTCAGCGGYIIGKVLQVK